MSDKRGVYLENTFHSEGEEFDIEEPDANFLQESHETPLISSHDVENGGPNTSHQLTFFNVWALIVGVAIGSGIFASPSRVDSNVPSPGMAIVVWGFAGFVGWTGATSFAELGVAMPKNGGMQEYLRYIYGDLAASLMTWTWVITMKPASIAIVSMIFADYWVSILAPSATGEKPFWMVKLLALITVCFVLLVNCVGAKSSSGLTTTLLYSKLSTVALILILAVSAIALSYGRDDSEPSLDWKSRDWFSPRQSSSVDWTNMSIWGLLGHLTNALYAALWASGGWDNVNLVAAEMRDPVRDLPRSVHAGIPTVTICFVLTNLAYYIIIPWNVVQESDAIAVAVGRQTMGTIGGLIFAILVSASCLGVLNIDVYTSGILVVASARHGYLPAFLIDPQDRDLPPQCRESSSNSRAPSMRSSKSSMSRIIEFLGLRSRQSTPIRAMVFICLLACPYTLLGTFGPLVSMSGTANPYLSTFASILIPPLGIAGYSFLFLTVFGLLILRVTQPHLNRPYKPWLIVPVIFCICSAFLVLRGVLYSPIQGAFLALLMGLGGCVHFWKMRKA